MSQEAQILRHLKSGNTITPMDALRDYGCMRLSGRIYDLRRLGHDIKSRMVEVNGRRIARYWMVSNG